jgi:hypothetical protein
LRHVLALADESAAELDGLAAYDRSQVFGRKKPATINITSELEKGES